MTVTGLGWRDALNAVRGARRCANLNFGFQRQLLAFEHEGLESVSILFLSKRSGTTYYLQLIKINVCDK